MLINIWRIWIWFRIQLVLIGYTNVDVSILRILHFKNGAISSTLLLGAKSRNTWILKLTAVTTSTLASSGAFAKLRKAAISFVMSVRLSIRTEQLGSHWTDFHEISYLRIFRKICRENSSLIEIWQERVLYVETYVHLWQYLAEFFLERDIAEKVVEKTKTHFVFSIFFPPENRAVYENKWNNTLESDRPQVI